ncbi:hypothetical protein OEZ85_005147 [Tetradesmus obliquus]|uniref:Cytochrome P450 n=1 Tax=Tetradesmus obliquus TaxID=3088 RepID=A0ABY8UH16_TETOB|nr:hypothetical protein OEZ85_005147 [Tetradesmus obliquus]
MAAVAQALGSSGAATQSSDFGGWPVMAFEQLEQRFLTMAGLTPSKEASDVLRIVVFSAAFAVAVLLAHLIKALGRYVRNSSVLSAFPLAPGSNILLGHVLPLLKCPSQGKGAWDLMEEWAKARGSIVRFRVLGTHGLVVNDPVAFKRIFQTRFKIYAKDLSLSYHPFMPILGTGLVTADGELWQKQRLLMGPALRVDILDDIVDIAQRGAARLADKLEQYRGTGQVVHLEEEFRLLTLQIIGEAILSLPPEECDRVFPQLYLPVMEEGNKRVLRPHRKYLPSPAWFAFKWRMARLNSFLTNLIRARWQARQAGKPGRGDILDRILAAIEAAGTKWSAAIETQLCYEMKTFLLAGHETSAAMLMWSVYELSRHPQQRDKVLVEAVRVFGPSGSNTATRPAADGMVYTLSVLKEALRRYSVVPVVTRTLKEDDQLEGKAVPAGTMIVCHLQGVHNQWSEPTAFRPERFMPGGEFDCFEEGVRPYMFVPFIQGPRNCLGQHLALLEARVVLALLQQRFSFKLASKLADPGQRHPTVIPVASIDGLPVTIE